LGWLACGCHGRWREGEKKAVHIKISIVYDFIAKLPKRAKASFIFTCRKINKEEKEKLQKTTGGKNYSWELDLH
jgi:hypothetical protein